MMFRPVSLSAVALGAFMALTVATWSTVAMAQAGDEASLQRGSQADTTPQQRYQTAIREAGGGLKVSMAECSALMAAERAPCQREARERYNADMAIARMMLKNPDARPVNITGGPIRSNETTYVVKP